MSTAFTDFIEVELKFQWPVRVEPDSVIDAFFDPYGVTRETLFTYVEDQYLDVKDLPLARNDAAFRVRTIAGRKRRHLNFKFPGQHSGGLVERREIKTEISKKAVRHRDYRAFPPAADHDISTFLCNADVRWQDIAPVLAVITRRLRFWFVVEPWGGLGFINFDESRATGLSSKTPDVMVREIEFELSVARMCTATVQLVRQIAQKFHDQGYLPSADSKYKQLLRASTLLSTRPG